MRRTLIYISAITFILIFLGCEKDNPAPKNVEPATETNYYYGLLVINEGNFGSGNASISHYVSSNNTVTQSVFSAVNSIPVGDVLQSGRKIDSLLYFVVNNSGKILVASGSTMKLKSTITGFNSPRYIQEIAGNKAIVTELYSNQLYVVDLLADSISSTISLNGWTEGMTALNDHVFITNKGRNQIVKLNQNTLAITDSINLSDGLANTVLDKNNKLWVLCSGSTSMSGRLYRIDPTSLTIEKTYAFADINARPSHLAVSPVGDQVYFINNHVYNMSITATQLPATPLIQNSGENFYGLTLDTNGDLYLTDAIDYVQRGKVYRYAPSGSLVNSFSGGINPNGIVFNR